MNRNQNIFKYDQDICVICTKYKNGSYLEYLSWINDGYTIVFMCVDCEKVREKLR